MLPALQNMRNAFNPSVKNDGELARWFVFDEGLHLVTQGNKCPFNARISIVMGMYPRILQDQLYSEL
jgi:hypothetical protein